MFEKVFKIQVYFFYLPSFLKKKKICLFLAALGLHCCTWTSSSGALSGDHSLAAVRRLLTVAASLVAEHGLAG